MGIKTFIVCLNKDISLEIAKDLVRNNDSLSIMPSFTTNIEYKNEVSERYENYLDIQTVNLAYKNNSLLYINTSDYISTGITIDDFYNNDVCFISVKEFNLIAENIFNTYDTLVVWVDYKRNTLITKNDLIEVDYFMQFLENHKYLYFLNTEPNISATILEYLKGTDEEREEILNDNK